MKADSEGRVGPSTYGRTHADAANVIARALKPHGGVVFYRAFVYNHHLDWRDLKNDRAKAAYDNFHPLDGAFDDNAIVQIKYGPIDFQVREPVSPLFGGLRHTNEAIELQITQEYTGQQRHLCFLAPMWKEILDFDLRVDDKPTPVKELVAGRVFHRPVGGFVGVANVGMDANWMGSPLAMANLYGFGRLAWNPNLSAEKIIDEWTRLTFGSDPMVVQTINAMQLASWHVYESYTGPLGSGNAHKHHRQSLRSRASVIRRKWMGAMASRRSRRDWDGSHGLDGHRIHRAISAGCAEDVRVAGGLSRQPIAVFSSRALQACADSGKTVVQHFYDSHYEGAEQAADFVSQWKRLQGHMDEERYADILARLQYQAGEAVVWRDAICNWIYGLSGIADAKGRVGAPKRSTWSRQ